MNLYAEYIKTSIINNKKPENSIEKWANDSNRLFKEGKMQMDNKREKVLELIYKQQNIKKKEKILHTHQIQRGKLTIALAKK